MHRQLFFGVVFLSSIKDNTLVSRLSSFYHYFRLLENDQQLVDFLSYDATWLNGKQLALELVDTLFHLNSTAFSTALCIDKDSWHLVLLSPSPETKRWYRCGKVTDSPQQQVLEEIYSIMEQCTQRPPKVLSNESWQLVPFIVSPLQQLFQRDIPYCVWLPKYGRLSVYPRMEQVVIFPGSFHPLHRGHLELAKVAERLSQRPVVFELAVVNADKGTQSESEVMHRSAQFTSELGYYCVLTMEPLFYKKAKLFPGAFFLVGVDTAQRMIDPKYYNHSCEEMIACLQSLMESGTKILVAGRLQDPSSNTGKFLTLQDISIPWAIQNLFYSIPQEMFRCDISSTWIRKQMQQEQQ